MSVSDHRRDNMPRRPGRRENVLRLLAHFLRNDSGAYAIFVGLALPVLVGAAAFGTEEGLLLYKHRQMQHAADSGAVSAAAAYVMGNSSVVTQADSVAASYGFVTGSNATVTVNQPPTSGPNLNNAQAIEVLISQNQPRLFSGIWGAGPIAVSARAVALPEHQACVLVLDRNASGAFSAQGSVNINLVNCAINDDSGDAQAMAIGGASTVSAEFVGVVGGISGRQSVTTVDGTVTGYHVVLDPYANVTPPPFSGCDYTNYSAKSAATISPGVYCGGMNLRAGAAVIMNPGIYYLDGGALSMAGSASLTGSGVTLVFTSSTGKNYATASLSGGATIDIAPPGSGQMSGIAIYGDHNMPLGTQFDFRGGSNQSIGGAVDLPRAAVNWAGNPTTQQPCTQLIADTIQFVGDSGLSINCSGYGTSPISTVATLLE